jgi:hypothetical protein
MKAAERLDPLFAPQPIDARPGSMRLGLAGFNWLDTLTSLLQKFKVLVHRVN